jgi:hypothetical protein
LATTVGIFLPFYESRSSIAAIAKGVFTCADGTEGGIDVIDSVPPHGAVTETEKIPEPQEITK